MFVLIQKLWNDESGQGVPEYALIVAFVAAMVALVGGLWGTQMQALVTQVGARITGAIPAVGGGATQ